MANYGWSANDLDMIASVKDTVSKWRKSFEKYLVPYDARVKLPDGDEKWSTIGDYDIDIIWTRHQCDGQITYEVMHTPGWDIDSGEQYCNRCHTQMVQDENGDWHCPECNNIYPEIDVEMGVTNFPTEEASYDWEHIEYNPAWYTNY